MQPLRLFAALVIGLLASHVTLAQMAPAEFAGVTGAPFSAVRSQQSARNFADGNRIDRGHSVRLYRDSQGRTRVEHDIPVQMVKIDDPVSGEIYQLDPRSKTAMVFKMHPPQGARPASEAPAVFVTWGGHLYGPKDPGWSQPVSLSEQSMDGIRVIGVRRQYTLAVGAVSNEKPIVLTVEQWYSPDLGLLIKKETRATTGGEFSMEVENVVRAEPDPALFQIPAGYTRVDVGHPSVAR